MFLIIVAALLDAVLGGRFLLGRLPNLNTFIKGAFHILERKLDRPKRTSTELYVRGLIILCFISPVLAAAGVLLNGVFLSGDIGFFICAFLLAPVIGLKADWQKTLSVTSPASSKQFDTNRHQAKTIILSFADKLISNSLLFAIGGFALFLPYRFLMCAVEKAEQIPKPAPFLKPLALLGHLVCLPGHIGAALLLAAAHIFVPGTKLGAIKGLFLIPTFKGVRAIPLNVIAEGLQLSFDSHNGKTQWIGPTNGTAQTTSAHLRKIWFLIFAACSVALLITVLITGFLLTQPE